LGPKGVFAKTGGCKIKECRGGKNKRARRVLTEGHKVNLRTIQKTVPGKTPKSVLVEKGGKGVKKKKKAWGLV